MSAPYLGAKKGLSPLKGGALAGETWVRFPVQASLKYVLLNPSLMKPTLFTSCGVERKANSFFSNQLFTMADLRNIAAGRSPYPVELTGEEEEDDDKLDDDDVDEDLSARAQEFFFLRPALATPGMPNTCTCLYAGSASAHSL